MHLERYSIHQFLVYSKTDAWRPTVYNVVPTMSVLVLLQILQKFTDFVDISHIVHCIDLQHNNLPISSILWEISQTIYQSYEIIIPLTKEYIQFIRKIGLHSIQQCWKWLHFSSTQAWSLFFHSSTAPSTNVWHKRKNLWSLHAFQLSRTLSSQILDDLLASKALEQATPTAP